jgi:hypothetical protein
MGTNRTLLVAAAVLTAGLWVAPQSVAQQAQATVKATSFKTAASPGKPYRWNCGQHITFEIAPVSSDVSSGKQAYVLVHYEKGEAVSAERVTETSMSVLKTMGCKPESPEGGNAFVGG